MKNILFFIMFLMISAFASGQMTYGGVPLSFQFNLSQDSIPFTVLPFISNHDLFDSIPIPSIDTVLSTDTVAGYDTIYLTKGRLNYIDRPVGMYLRDGYTYKLPNGNTIIRLAIVSDSAEHINANFNNFKLDSTERLYIYSYSHKSFVGAYTSYSAGTSTILRTNDIRGDTFIVEYNRLDSTYERDSLLIYLKSAGHVIPKSMTARSADCFINANCSQWDGLCNEIRSNVYLSLDKHTCSGVLVANVRNNLKPYILTAKHCVANRNGDLNFDKEKAYAFFNFETAECSGSDIGPNGLFELSLHNSHIWTSPFLYTNDLALIELEMPIPIQWNPFYAGWNLHTDRNDLPTNSNAPFIDVNVIHHPDNEPAKISQGDVKPSLLAKKWFVHYDQSSSDPGSSGAPLFDVDHRVIGAVSGGLASCNNSLNDYYGKLGKFDDFESVIATYSPGTVFVTYNGSDPMLLCQDHIDLNGDIYDASIWRASNTDAILIEAENNININSLGQGVTFKKNSNYILQAGSEILIEPGINYPTIIQGDVKSVIATIHECNLILNSCYNFKEAAAYNQDSYTSRELNFNTGFNFNIYPNPSSGNVTIKFSMVNDAEIAISLIDMTGRAVSLIANDWFIKGTSIVKFDSAPFASGIYLVQFAIGKTHYTQRLVIER